MKTIEKGNDLPLTDLPLNELTMCYDIVKREDSIQKIKKEAFRVKKSSKIASFAVSQRMFVVKCYQSGLNFQNYKENTL